MKMSFLLLFVAILTVGHSKKAYCILDEDLNSGVSGRVEFYQPDEQHPTSIVAKVKGLKDDSFHGFHIHEKNDFTGGCKSAGPHYNPFNKEHGSPNADNRHVGDMGNLHSQQFEAEMSYTDPLITLYGPYSIINRACVVHENPDDLGQGNAPDSKSTGNSGVRIACGAVIEGELPKEEQFESSNLKDNSFIWKFFIVIGIGALFYLICTKSSRGYARLDESK